VAAEALSKTPQVEDAVEKPKKTKQAAAPKAKSGKRSKKQVDDFDSAAEIAEKLVTAQVASSIQAKPIQGSKEIQKDFDFREEEMLLDHLRYASKVDVCKKCNLEYESAFFTIWLESGFSESELSALTVLSEGEKAVVGNGFSVTIRDNSCAHISRDFASDVEYVVGGTIVSQTNWNPLFVKASDIADALKASGFADELLTSLDKQYDSEEHRQFAEDQLRVVHLKGNAKGKGGFQFVMMLSTHNLPLSIGMEYDLSVMDFPVVRVVDDGWHIEIHEENDDLASSLKLAQGIVDNFGGSLLSSAS
jgi:hypothetical protein